MSNRSGQLTSFGPVEGFLPDDGAGTFEGRPIGWAFLRSSGGGPVCPALLFPRNLPL
ncbi:hypothetical protein [Cognatishimia sp. F0-27]|uniref:hypothetical protein n=1 Tax=Cognatishimia sp. F0-27 TaxID=2816855 RepID=UPI001D0C5612|nr:hypothetical protein [Cognatishimia sp. F0-27]MCC1493704.1 hypothetical protein [Cognatishimia sp. F0-27]